MICTLLRKPREGNTISSLPCGVLAIDLSRVGFRAARLLNRQASIGFGGSDPQGIVPDGGVGRFPANIIVTFDPEVVGQFPDNIKGQVGMLKIVGGHRFMAGDLQTVQKFDHGTVDYGSAARFFKQVEL